MGIKRYFLLFFFSLRLICILGHLVFFQNLYAHAILSSQDIQTCLDLDAQKLSVKDRLFLADCLAWHADPKISRCRGFYQNFLIKPILDDEAIEILASRAALKRDGSANLDGDLEFRHQDKQINAEHAELRRSAKSHQIERIDFWGSVRVMQNSVLMLAKSLVIYPKSKSAQASDLWFRIQPDPLKPQVFAYGHADHASRDEEENLHFENITYSTCPVNFDLWQLYAKKLEYSKIERRAKAESVVFSLRNRPIFYSPYLNFSTHTERHTGFLIPKFGYNNLSGFQLATPYYLNLAPNRDATLTPQFFSRRGVMMSGEFRHLEADSNGLLAASILPDDQVFKAFLSLNKTDYPRLQALSPSRWSLLLDEQAKLSEDLSFALHAQKVSDDYYLQDFSSNLVMMTENQLQRFAHLSYDSDHWSLLARVEEYQTLHAINQSTVDDIYARLPQLRAKASYGDLPWHGVFDFLSEFDYFYWPSSVIAKPDGARYHLNPALSFPIERSYGFFKPRFDWVENYYQINNPGVGTPQAFQRSFLRSNLDAGLTFEREINFLSQAYVQTLEPRAYYLYVPYQNQSQIPAFESAYMIFTADQLFRSNRFSGFDRISDAHHIAYALTSRLLATQSGAERLSLSLGQIKYFSKRRVELCYALDGSCSDDVTPYVLGYLSPEAKTSPIASRLNYQMNSSLNTTVDYVWDPFTRATNNASINLHYQPNEFQVYTLAYSYLVNGNVLLQEQRKAPASLHQLIGAWALPLTEHWSTLGVYSYNIAEGYDMLEFLGLEYNHCCWAMRVLGGRSFKSLSPDSFKPRYNNNIYVQFSLKGLGSTMNADPGSIIKNYLPGYVTV